MNTIKETIAKMEPEFIEIRHYLHQHPEIGFEEHNTSELVANKLRAWGYEVHEKVGKTGVVGVLKSGDSGKSIGIRADMDALPFQEDVEGKDWGSQIAGRCHGCGHDGHTTTLLCAAKYLAETKHFNGTVYLFFQPAEELLYGGQVMLDDNLFERFPCDYIYGLHNMVGTGMEPGKFYFRKGAAMASSDTIHVEITGSGAHGAQPENGIDATLVACQIGVALQSIVSRNVSPLDQAVITVGCIESGHAPNVINDKALMKLSIRALRNEVRNTILQRVSDLVKLQAESFGASAKCIPISGCPALENPEDGFDLAVQVAESLVGSENVVTNTPPLMGSEDFSFMINKHPHGCYFYVGGKFVAPLHNPKYDFDDNIIVLGASYWSSLVETYLQ